MGQKVNPVGLRIGINRTWDSIWFASGKSYPKILHQDLAIRKLVSGKTTRSAGVSKVVIERVNETVSVLIYAARPGNIIGKKGQLIEKMKEDVIKMTGSKEVSINLVQMRRPESDARLIAENIAQNLENRGFYRRAMKRAIQSAMRLEIKGIRVNCSGRLGGAEIARMEWYREGRVPLHTLRADIDYGFAVAKASYGTIGVKVWVFKGEILKGRDKKQGGKDATAT